MASLKDVARAAGLSVTTASRALNNHGDVASSTRALVAQVALDLGYHPNHAARSLQGTFTDTIGLVIPRLVHRYVDSFWLEFIGGASAACADAGFDLLLSSGDNLSAEHAHYQRLIRTRRVDGVILCDIRVRDPRVTFLRSHAAPFVTFGRALGDNGYSWVDVDGAAGLRLAVQHLLALGHRRMAFLGTARDYSFSHFRFEGYQDSLLAAGIPYDNHLVVQDLAVGADLDAPLGRMLGLASPPTAIIACADFLAASALTTLRRLGRSVPEDLSLVAFDDTLVTQHAEPPLTTLRQDNHAIGSAVASLLIRQLRDPDRAPEHTLLQPQLVSRRSSSRVADR
ncbi:MAG TPA: LacI family DNA-binding transcriptional regulator [Chloroflexota bacterium]|nr:LacI family DNA-binding transcriptional regulator [Chloroflexota bacterium]